MKYILRLTNSLWNQIKKTRKLQSNNHFKLYIGEQFYNEISFNSKLEKNILLKKTTF